ncbi:MAG: response regulator transcription factor [Ignavibacteriaceae bacterium]|jgi:DNA-binding NarL/FixJ family response regulator|nr:response regulator transcription factor [Ignavibacteriaceae bacterium]
MSIKIAIVEDHNEYRESIAFIFNNTEGFECTAKFSSMEEALSELPKADVFLLDINLPGISGIEGIGKIKQKSPTAKILMLTVQEDNNTIFNAILSGADGYLLKKTSPIRILQAVEDVYAGGYPMTPITARQILDFFKKNFSVTKEDEKLTEREKEVLSLIVQGRTNDEISEKLFISLITVRNHIAHIYEKLHVHSKAQAVAKAIRERIV